MLPRMLAYLSMADWVERMALLGAGCWSGCCSGPGLFGVLELETKQVRQERALVAELAGIEEWRWA